jgi:hypothetical protein
MNKRQALKAAAERIKEQDRILALNKADIMDYNACITDMIAGKGPCQWCEDYNECQLASKGPGCTMWMLRSQKVGDPDGSDAGKDGDPVQRLEE